MSDTSEELLSKIFDAMKYAPCFSKPPEKRNEFGELKGVCLSCRIKEAIKQYFEENLVEEKENAR